MAGTDEYRRRLVLAEIRDKGKASWFAVVASAKPLGTGIDPEETVLEVVARFKAKDDPVFVILETMGPWIVDTIPFVPSQRQGQVVVKKAKPKEVQALRDRQNGNLSNTTSKMVAFGIEFDPKDKIHSELRVLRNIEVEALAIEFGMAKNSKPHWRPSLRWIKRNIVQIATKERDLFRVWYDPEFKKYRVKRRLRVQLSVKDLQRIKEFQDKVRV